MLLASVLLSAVTWWCLTEASPVSSPYGVLREADFEKSTPSRRVVVRVVRDTAGEVRERSQEDDDALPSDLALRSFGKDHDVKLRLRREPLLKVRANLEDVTSEAPRGAAVYTDPNLKATVLVRRHSGGLLSMEGRWEHADREVRISPVRDPATERSEDASVDHVVEEYPRLAADTQTTSEEERAEGQYVLELLLVADFFDYEMWGNWAKQNTIAEMTLYYTFMAKDLQARYASIKKVNLDVRVVGLEIMTEVAKSPWIAKGKPDAGVALDKFSVWVGENAAKLPKADNYATFTALPIEYNGGPLVGIAELGESCNSKSVSLNLDRRFFALDTLTLAHELGHNLGMEHTFDTECKEPDGHIMSYKDWDPNNWSFTACSVQSLMDHIKKSSCIETSGAKMVLTTKLLGGQHMDANAQCALSVKDGKWDGKGLEKICYSMNCCSDTLGCRHIEPMDHTDCGAGKWCIQGKCVPKSDSGSVDDGGSGDSG